MKAEFPGEEEDGEDLLSLGEKKERVNEGHRLPPSSSHARCWVKSGSKTPGGSLASGQTRLLMDLAE